MRGVVGEVDGKPLMFAGVLLTEPLHAFSAIREEGRKHKKLIIKTLREFTDLVDSMGAPVYALADENEPNSEKVLMLAGFDKKHGRIYATGGK